MAFFSDDSIGHQAINSKESSNEFDDEDVQLLTSSVVKKKIKLTNKSIN